MSSSIRVCYAPLSEATPEAEVEALAAIYRFLIDRHEDRMAAGTGGRSERKGVEDGGSGASLGSTGSPAPDRRDESIGKFDEPRKEVIKDDRDNKMAQGPRGRVDTRRE